MSATVQARSSIEHPEAVFFGPRPGYGRELWAVLSIARLTAIRLRETVVRQRHVETERIRNLVTSTLQRIAAGDTSPELRREALLLEGELRDALRGRRLAAGPVPSAARAARSRGVDVVLLDDLGDPGEGSTPEAVPAAALDWVASRLSAAAPPRATLRLAVGADGRPAISFYAENSGDPPEFLALDPAEPPPRIRPEERGRTVSPSSGRAGR